MSLTSHLADTSSPVHAWFAQRLPNAAAVRPWRAATLLVAPDAVPPLPARVPAPSGWPILVAPAPGVSASTVGTAFDYRLRFLLDPRARVAGTVAELGARALANWYLRTSVGLEHAVAADGTPDILDWDQPVTQAFTQVHLETNFHLHSTPAWQVESDDRELELARLCWLLALFEQVYRSGIDPAAPLVAAGPRARLEDLLPLVPDAGARDVVALTRLAAATQPGLLRAGRVRVGPTFAASSRLGGADADVILDGLLLEVKATVDPHLDRDRVWQLAGYALADLPDSQRIRRVGIYYARHGQLLTWPLRDYLSALAGGRASVRGLRTEFGTLLDSLGPSVRLNGAT